MGLARSKAQANERQPPEVFAPKLVSRGLFIRGF